MSQRDRSMLRDLLVTRYDSLRAKLAAQLGSDARASDVLHDTYMRLHRTGDITVTQPAAYLYRMALNVAWDSRRAEGRTVQSSEVDAIVLERTPDDRADALRAIEARQEVDKLEAALAELTPRRRRILLASRVQGRTLKQIAAQLDVSQRLVEIELKLALAHCAERLDRPVIQRFGPKPLAPSS